MESDDDLEIWSSLEIGFDYRDALIVRLDFADYDDHTRDNVLYAVVDADEVPIMVDHLRKVDVVPTADLPKAIAERCAGHPVPVPPSYVRSAFKEVLDCIIDCGARYRLREA